MYGGRRMSDLEETLKRISYDFANDVIAALAKLPFEAWYEETAPKPAPRSRRRTAAPTAPESPAESDTETSILEHLNEAGPTGSTARAWVISTHGELASDEHDRLEHEARAVLDALEAKGLIQKQAHSRSRGQVYALAPV